jgi:hypothetical protein
MPTRLLATRSASLVTKHSGGALNVVYTSGLKATLTLSVSTKRSAATFDTWRLNAWRAFHDAAIAQFQDATTRLQANRDRLWSDLANKDTLTLRRMEREELLKSVIEWLVGPDLDTAPTDVANTIEAILKNEATGAIPLPKIPGVPLPPALPPPHDMNAITPAAWSRALSFGEFVKFIHQSVEWENILYFLYPYFWGSEALAREKLLFDHTDSLHRDFLRAGYARVVIPIPSDYEARFMNLLDTGDFSGDTSSSPYMTIAEEVANFARTNYAGIPPANPETRAPPAVSRTAAGMGDDDAGHRRNREIPRQQRRVPAESRCGGWRFLPRCLGTRSRLQTSGQWK